MFNLFKVIIFFIVFVNNNNPVCKTWWYESFLSFSTSLDLKACRCATNSQWFMVSSSVSYKSFTSSCELNARLIKYFVQGWCLVQTDILGLFILFDHIQMWGTWQKQVQWLAFNQPKYLVSFHNLSSYWSWSTKASISSSSKDLWNISVMVCCWGSWHTARGLKTNHTFLQTCFIILQ